MVKEFIAVRGVDEEVYRRFRARAVRNRLKVGVALTKAMNEWVEKNDAAPKKNMGPQTKPFDWGPGNEKLSEEIDEILYGWKK